MNPLGNGEVLIETLQLPCRECYRARIALKSHPVFHGKDFEEKAP